MKCKMPEMIEKEQLNITRESSRREFLKVAGATVSGVILSACSSRIPVTNTPLASPESSEVEIEPTAARPTATIQATVEPIYPEMVPVEPGTFQMGSEDGYRFEQPVHTVTLTRSFNISIYALTYAEYDRFCDDVGRSYVDDDGLVRETRPVSGVDWSDAVEYCNWLSERAGLVPCYSGKGKVTKCDFLANGYRLPTEAEWEYAARGGPMSQGYVYAGGNDPDEVGWHADNSDGSTHPVGQKKPNELGAFDMSGNRWEWCWDWFEPDYYSWSPDTDPTGPSEIPEGLMYHRSRRGGSAVEDADTLRTAYRSADTLTYAGDNGIRLVTTA